MLLNDECWQKISPVIRNFKCHIPTHTKNTFVTPKEKFELNVEQRALLFRVPFSVGKGMLEVGRRTGTSPRRSVGPTENPHSGREGSCGCWKAQDDFTLGMLSEENHRCPSQEGEEHIHFFESQVWAAYSPEVIITESHLATCAIKNVIRWVFIGNIHCSMSNCGGVFF